MEHLNVFHRVTFDLLKSDYDAYRNEVVGIEEEHADDIEEGSCGVSVSTNLSSSEYSITEGVSNL